MDYAADGGEDDVGSVACKQPFSLSKNADDALFSSHRDESGDHLPSNSFRDTDDIHHSA
jgi:hypothetical protein